MTFQAWVKGCIDVRRSASLLRLEGELGCPSLSVSKSLISSLLKKKNSQYVTNL